VNADLGRDIRSGDGEPAAGLGAGRALASAALVVVACCLALLPAAIGLQLLPWGGQALALALGAAALFIGALKVLALTWALAERMRPGHPVRLANVHPD
jgi:uncharacterized membrane protein